jgi:Fic family protein
MKIEDIISIYQSSVSAVFDYNKFSLISMSFHSTALEGSTLTLPEAEALLDKGITALDRPMEHHLMLRDHHEALMKFLAAGERKDLVSESLIKGIAATVMKNTGSIHNVATGSFDSSQGDYRLMSVRAGSHYFVAANKIAPLMRELVDKVNDRLSTSETLEDKLNLSFDFHFDLVSIHPFVDGNGRTSRLMSNFVQKYFNLPIAPVEFSSRASYIKALEESRQSKDILPFRRFMVGQYTSYLKSEVSKIQEANREPTKNKGKGYSMVF